MVWILLVMSAGAYNFGTVTAVEFNSQQACIEAQVELKKQGGGSTVSMCVKKG